MKTAFSNTYSITCVISTYHQLVSQFKAYVKRPEGRNMPFLKMHITYIFITYFYTDVTRVCRVLKGYIYHKNWNEITNH